MCTPGPEGPCDDGNPCTIESCDAQMHCLYAPDLPHGAAVVTEIDRAGSDTNRLVWKWVHGDAINDMDSPIR